MYISFTSTITTILALLASLILVLSLIAGIAINFSEGPPAGVFTIILSGAAIASSLLLLAAIIDAITNIARIQQHTASLQKMQALQLAIAHHTNQITYARFITGKSSDAPPPLRLATCTNCGIPAIPASHCPSCNTKN